MITKVSIVYLSGYNEKPTTAAKSKLLLTALHISFNPNEKGRMYTRVGVAALFTQLSHKRTDLQQP